MIVSLRPKRLVSRACSTQAVASIATKAAIESDACEFQKTIVVADQMNDKPSILRACFALILAITAGLLSGCASKGLPPAPASVAQEDYSYIIGPGDALNVIVWRNPELSMAVPVRPDGKIAAPLVDELVAQGKTSVQLARDVEKVLGKYVRDPIVTVLVTAFVGPYSEQIRVVGEAARPQALPYRNKMTLLDVMIATGGLTDFAAGNRAILLRSAEGNKQYALRLKDLLKGGDVGANVEMRPGDIIIIPQSLF
jgi:polysaccharide biosynthesis/export protein